MNTIKVSSKNVIYASKILFAMSNCYPEHEIEITEDHNLFRIAVWINDDPVSINITNDAFNRYALEGALKEGIKEAQIKDHDLLTFITGYPSVYIT